MKARPIREGAVLARTGRGWRGLQMWSGVSLIPSTWRDFSSPFPRPRSCQNQGPVSRCGRPNAGHPVFGPDPLSDSGVSRWASTSHDRLSAVCFFLPIGVSSFVRCSRSFGLGVQTKHLRHHLPRHRIKIASEPLQSKRSTIASSLMRSISDHQSSSPPASRRPLHTAYTHAGYSIHRCRPHLARMSSANLPEQCPHDT